MINNINDYPIFLMYIKSLFHLIMNWFSTNQLRSQKKKRKSQIDFEKKRKVELID